MIETEVKQERTDGLSLKGESASVKVCSPVHKCSPVQRDLRCLKQTFFLPDQKVSNETDMFFLLCLLTSLTSGFFSQDEILMVVCFALDSSRAAIGCFVALLQQC